MLDVLNKVPGIIRAIIWAATLGLAVMFAEAIIRQIKHWSY